MSVSAIKSTPPAPLAAAASLKVKKKTIPAKVSTVPTVAQAAPVKQSTPAASIRIDVKA
jgi:hypothetical protein